MPEDKIVPTVLTTRELVYGMPQMRWEPKVDLVRSETGGFLSLAAASSGDFASQITATDLMTGVGTLASAGIRFHLRTVVIASAGKTTVYLMDGASTKLGATVASGTTVLTDLMAPVFQTDCRAASTSAAVRVTVGGIREVVLA